jgi:methionyl-tRNA formyltransferase
MTLLLKAPLPEHPGIVFMGTPEFAVYSLNSLIDAGYDIRGVVTQPDRPRGRGRNVTASPVKEAALEHSMKVMQPAKISDAGFLAELKELDPDLIIVVAFGQILKKMLLEMPGWGVINIHASLLPKYRGAAPIQRVILNNESSTGLTIMKMDEGLDTGPILYQKEIPILKDETTGQLHDRLAGKSGHFLVEFLKNMTRGQIGERPQDSLLATYADKIDKEMTIIDWSRDAMEISALIRALDPAPGAHTNMGDVSIKLFSSTVPDDTYSDAAPGRVLDDVDGELRIGTGKGIVGVRELQYPGKKRLHVREFLMGHHLSKGTILGKQ